MDNMHEHTDNATEQMREVASQLETLIEAIQGEELDESKLGELNEVMKRLADIERQRYGQSNNAEQQQLTTRLAQLRQTAEQILRYFVNQRTTGNETERAAQEEVRRSQERERARRVAEQAANAAATASRQMGGIEPQQVQRASDEDSEDSTQPQQPQTAQQVAHQAAQTVAEVSRQMRGDDDGDPSRQQQSVAPQPEPQQPASEQPQSKQEDTTPQPQKESGQPAPTLLGTMREIGRGIRWLTNTIRQGGDGEGSGGIFQAGAQVAALHATQSQAMGVLQTGNPLAYDTILGSMKLLTAHISSAFTPAAMAAAGAIQDMTKHVDAGIAGYKSLDASLDGNLTKFVKFGTVVGVAAIAIGKLRAAMGLLNATMLGNPLAMAAISGAYVMYQMGQDAKHDRLGRGYPQLSGVGEEDDDGMTIHDRIQQKKRIRMKDIEPYLTRDESDRLRVIGNNRRGQREFFFQTGAGAARRLEAERFPARTALQQHREDWGKDDSLFGVMKIRREELQRMVELEKQRGGRRGTFEGVDANQLADTLRGAMMQRDYRETTGMSLTKKRADEAFQWAGLDELSGVELSRTTERMEMLQKALQSQMGLSASQSKAVLKGLHERGALGDLQQDSFSPQDVEQLSRNIAKVGNLPAQRLDLMQAMREAGTTVDVENKRKGPALGRMNELTPQITSLENAWQNIQRAQLGMSELDAKLLQKQRENMRDAVKDGVDQSTVGNFINRLPEPRDNKPPTIRD